MFLCDTEINLSVCNDNLQSILKQPIKMNKKEYKKIGMNIKDKREIILEIEENKINKNSYLQMGIGGCSQHMEQF